MEAVFSFIAQVLRISAPYALAASGGALSERCGVINIALEGIMLGGAFGAAAGTIASGDPWLGALCGLAAGAFLALLHAAVTVGAKADQILSGLAINLLALGATRGMLRVLYGSSSNSPRLSAIPEFDAPWLRPLGALAEVIGDPLFLLAAALIAGAQVLLFGTGFGLSLRAAGDGPEALDGAGLSVSQTRYAGVILSGVLGGAAGVWLVMQQRMFSDGMSGGRGYIALAAMIVGRWSPLGGALACLLFGVAETAQMRIPGDVLPTQFVQMLPYVVTLIVLVGWVGRSHPPTALGEPYDRERR